MRSRNGILGVCERGVGAGPCLCCHYVDKRTTGTGGTSQGLSNVLISTVCTYESASGHVRTEKVYRADVLMCVRSGF